MPTVSVMATKQFWATHDVKHSVSLYRAETISSNRETETRSLSSVIRPS